jgi:HCOMODA/2-hydroxy-3-carboxy-muconic semialdehyde decarboxylase
MAAFFLHAPTVKSIVHSHSHAVVPFSVGGEKIRPLMLNCAVIGKATPIWDSRDNFGDTDLMVTTMEWDMTLPAAWAAIPPR